METVTLVVEAYPFDGVVGIKAEQLTTWGWVSVLDEDTVGTFPNYVTSYQVSVFDPIGFLQLRVKWQISATQHTNWFSPLSIAFDLTVEGVERMTQAVIQKATRILVMAEAPLGSWGEMTEFGMATVRPDYAISELLYGLRLRNWDVDLTTLVTTDDVIRQGLQVTDPDDFPSDRLPDVQRAIDSAISWVAHYILEGVGIA